MNKKIMRLLTLAASLLLLFSAGCSKGDGVSKTEKTVDTSFIDDVEKALEKRWEYNDDVADGKTEIYDDVEHYEKLISFEKELLYKYEKKDFNDPKLKAIAMDYINGIKTQEESIKYYNVDYSKYDEQWFKGYDERSTALLTLVEDYGLKVNKEQFKDLKTNAQIVRQQSEAKSKVEEMVRNIKFKKTSTEYDWTTYKATVENTSGADIDGFGLEINLLDKEGVVIGTESAYHDNTWKAGQKILLEFSTDTKGFEKMEWEPDYYFAESE